MSPEEKAARQILEMIESSYKPREQRDLAAWIVSSLRRDVVKGLAHDFDDQDQWRAEVESEGDR